MNNLELAAATGRILPGDVLCFQNGERGILNAAIRAVQKRALLDLDDTLSPASAENAAIYTHCAQVLGLAAFAEQYSPHARMRWMEDVPPGTIILVKRLKDATPLTIEPILRHWQQVVARKEPYPLRELIYYYCKWASKLSLTRKFADVFRDKRHNVCSGEVVHASQKGGWFEGERPEAWYPARIALDYRFFWYIDIITV